MVTGFLDQYVGDGPARRRHQLYVPWNYDANQSWPLLVFLHGAGEGGRNALLPTEYQLGSAIRRDPGRFPALALFPQVSQTVGWTPREIVSARAALDQTIADYAIDDHRIYLSGVSCGGIAAWRWLTRDPNRFAAALVVCGRLGGYDTAGDLIAGADAIGAAAGADPFEQLARRIAHVPVWFFHGDDDPLYPVDDARAIAAALKRCDARFRYSELAGFGHDVWDIAYYAEAVWDWLFSQQRDSRSPADHAQ